MMDHSQLSPEKVRSKIRNHTICFGGNKKLKIYGLLNCRSGKRMKMENRVFFTDEKEAVESNFRPCGHCMKTAYQLWKQKSA